MKKKYWKQKVTNRFYQLSEERLNKITILKKIRRKNKITEFCVNKTFLVHNGKSFKKISIKDKMVGLPFGTFSTTKKQFSNKNEWGKK